MVCISCHLSINTPSSVTIRMTQDVLEKYTELLASKSHNLVNGDEEIKKQSLLTSKHLFDRGKFYQIWEEII